MHRRMREEPVYHMPWQSSKYEHVMKQFYIRLYKYSLRKAFDHNYKLITLKNVENVSAVLVVELLSWCFLVTR